MPVGDQVVFRAGTAPADWRRARVAPPFGALTCEESTTQRDQSRREAAFSSASRTSWSRCHTPASFQSRNRRQQSCPSRSPAPWADTPTGCRCAARTGFRTARPGRAAACGLDSGSAARAAAAAVPRGPTAHPTRSTAMSRHTTERSTHASDTVISADPPRCVSRCMSRSTVVVTQAGLLSLAGPRCAVDQLGRLLGVSVEQGLECSVVGVVVCLPVPVADVVPLSAPDGAGVRDRGRCVGAGSELEGAHVVRSPSASDPASPPPAATASARTSPCPGGPCG